tara:strand:- start:496 stop:972 length:477 start_codon:yes stop_codon:yes gene_type:complete
MGVFKRWFALTNLIVIGGAFLYITGIIPTIIETDVSHISYVIGSMFFIALILTGILSYRIGLNKGTTRMDDNMLYISWFIAEVLMVLGLAGTVIGFIVLFGGSFDGVSFDDPETVKAVITSIASGMGVALYTTISGIFCAILTKMLLVNVEVTIHEQE